MAEPIDTWRSAQLLIEQYGDGASGRAMQHAIDSHARGDADDEAAWLRVFDAIRELQRAIRGPQEQAH